MITLLTTASTMTRYNAVWFSKLLARAGYAGRYALPILKIMQQ